MHELPWITIFGHEWGDLPMMFTSKERVKITDKSPHSWPKIVIHGKEYIISFLARYFMSWTHSSTKNNHRLFTSPLLPRKDFSALTLWRHHSWSVTSHERVILSLWRHTCRLFLHAQIGRKQSSLANNNREYPISHHPVFTAYRVRKYAYCWVYVYSLPVSNIVNNVDGRGVFGNWGNDAGKMSLFSVHVSNIPKHDQIEKTWR